MAESYIGSGANQVKKTAHLRQTGFDWANPVSIPGWFRKRMNDDEILNALDVEQAAEFRKKRDELIEFEKRKGDADYDGILHWKRLQETITWVETNLPRHLQHNRPENRLAEERRKNSRRD